MNIAPSDKNCTISDSPVREHKNDEHDEVLNRRGGSQGWRGGRGGRGGERRGHRGGRGGRGVGGGDADVDDRWNWRRDNDGPHNEGEEPKALWRRGDGRTSGYGGEGRRGGRAGGGGSDAGGFRGGSRHYDTHNSESWSNWRRKEGNNYNNKNNYDTGYSRAEADEGGDENGQQNENRRGGRRGQGGERRGGRGGRRSGDMDRDTDEAPMGDFAGKDSGEMNDPVGADAQKRGRGGRGRGYRSQRESRFPEADDSREYDRGQPRDSCEGDRPQQQDRDQYEDRDQPRGREQPQNRYQQRERHEPRDRAQDQDRDQRRHREYPRDRAQHQDSQDVRAEEHGSSNPNRTQRPPNRRRNCFDDREVELLFEHHHQQKGISLDNYANIPVDIVPRDVDPVESFEDLFVEEALARNIAKCGYKRPTPVQRFGIPVCLKNADLMACAQTGSGKTAAFLVPVVNYILRKGVSPARNRVSYPIAVIMAPTRELALQIYDEVRKLTFRTDIFYDVVYGGTPYPTRFENDILVACPGRLKDIFDRQMVSFSEVKFLVLDEADRMLEMGFEEQIEYLVASRYTDMPQTSDRQTLMFSATFPQRILNLAKRYLRQQYYLLTVGRVGSTTKNITQRIENVQDSDKMDKLFEIIYKQNQTDLILVFVETKLSAENLHYALKMENIPSATIHGDRKQSDRERALRDFKEGITPILVATDVASRGLDIPNVAHVIQYDLPKEMDDYTHRIGRTGRAGNKGVATSLYNRSNRGIAVDLYNYLTEHEQEIPAWFEEEKDNVDADRFIGMNRDRGNRRGGGGYGGGGGGDGFRAPAERSNATWGETNASYGGRVGGGNGRNRGGAKVDDGGF